MEWASTVIYGRKPRNLADCENSQNNAWNLNLTTGNMNNNDKTNNSNSVRAVSASLKAASTGIKRAGNDNDT